MSLTSVNKQLSILLVEDDPVHAGLIRRALHSHSGMTLKTLGNLESCRAAMASSVPDLLILDMNLPDGRAIDLLKEGEPGCPVLILTSRGSETLVVEALKAGALDYIVKSTKAFEAMPRIIERTMREWRVLQERHQALQALRESELRFRTLLQDVQSVAVRGYRPDGTVFYWNRAAEQLFGYLAEEAIGQNFLNLIVPETGQERMRADIQSMATGHKRVPAQEIMLFHKNGTPVTVYSSFATVAGQEGPELYNIEIDISERKRAENELVLSYRKLENAISRANDMARKAEVASVAKSDFLANMSHEIRTPLNGIIGMAGLLLNTELSEEQQRYVDMVNSSSEALLMLVNDILDVSKIEAGKLELEKVDFNLTTVLDDLAAEHALPSQKKNLELICTADAQVPTSLTGDPGRLRQVLANLVGNSIKFTTAGEVVLQVKLLDQDADDVRLHFRVSDTGMGIPRDKQSLLFDKFSQVDTSTTRKYGGTGLGLAISKQLVALMDGEIGVESEEGKGSTFWFSARFGRSPEAATAKAPSCRCLQDVRVLIVDDNASNAKLLAHHLTAWGMRPATVCDSFRALPLLLQAKQADDPFGVVVIDKQMPEMDGLALGESVMAEPALSSLRMVLMVNLEDHNDLQRFKDIGFSGRVTKPIRYLELKRVLGQALGCQCEQPAATPGSKATPVTSDKAAVAEQSRILLVEDNLTNQQVVLGMLKKLGLGADVAANGVEAIQALKAASYDLVFMDCQMPELDGYGATAQLRDPATGVKNRSVPVVALTANAMPSDREKCLQAGMDDYLAKPIMFPALIGALNRWLSTSYEIEQLKKKP